ncbi:MAG: sel1 repeat family protein [Gammaproteobacteria bacterium]|nr:sel1 repeat family protein [Gammaproteobacteria bacterium]
MPHTFIRPLTRLIGLCLFTLVISVAQAEESTLAALEKQAAAGDVQAQLALADRYYKGEGVVKNTAKAAHWYQGLAEKGFVQAQLTLGLMHIKGDGVVQDDKKAIHWLTQAAENKSSAAQHLLGIAYAEGHGVTADPIKAYMWFEIAAVMEYPNAVESRRELAAKMNTNDIKRAEQMASEWWIQHHQ